MPLVTTSMVRSPTRRQMVLAICAAGRHAPSAASVAAAELDCVTTSISGAWAAKKARTGPGSYRETTVRPDAARARLGQFDAACINTCDLQMGKPGPLSQRSGIIKNPPSGPWRVLCVLVLVYAWVGLVQPASAQRRGVLRQRSGRNTRSEDRPPAFDILNLADRGAGQESSSTLYPRFPHCSECCNRPDTG